MGREKEDAIATETVREDSGGDGARRVEKGDAVNTW